jgi:hypothetical protein
MCMCVYVYQMDSPTDAPIRTKLAIRVPCQHGSVLRVDSMCSHWRWHHGGRIGRRDLFEMKNLRTFRNYLICVKLGRKFLATLKSFYGYTWCYVIMNKKHTCQDFTFLTKFWETKRTYLPRLYIFNVNFEKQTNKKKQKHTCKDFTVVRIVIVMPAGGKN